MRQCAYCGVLNPDEATNCQQCRNPLPDRQLVAWKPRRFGPEKGHEVRKKAMAAVALGLLMKIYWGGHGPWTVIDSPTLEQIRTYLEPLLLYGGIALYAVGWLLNWI